MNTIYETGFGDGDNEMGRNAKAIFDARIAPILRETDIGKYLVIDTETGDFEIDTSHYVASRRASAKRPGAHTRLAVRIGYRAVYNNWATFPMPVVNP